jgi:hypothetical protein
MPKMSEVKIEWSLKSELTLLHMPLSEEEEEEEEKDDDDDDDDDERERKGIYN